MKNLYTAGLLFVLLFTAHLLHAQVEPPLNEPIPDKPLLFVSLPDKFECDLAELEKLFSNSVSQTFSVRLMPARRSRLASTVRRDAGNASRGRRAWRDRAPAESTRHCGRRLKTVAAGRRRPSSFLRRGAPTS